MVLCLMSIGEVLFCIYVLSSEFLKSFDPYGDQKRDAFLQSQAAMTPLISRISAVTKNTNEGQSLAVFREFLSVSISCHYVITYVKYKVLSLT